MKIAMIAEPYVPIPPLKYGGTERVIYHLIKGLQERGHEVTLLASGDSQIDCKIIPICDKSFFFGKTTSEQKAVDKKAKQVKITTKKILHSLKNEVDIIHSHGFDLIDFEDFPNVTTLHSTIKLDEMEYYEKRQNLNFVSISENQQHTFPTLKYMGIAYNGLDPAEFRFEPNPQDYLCFIGRFDRDKNPGAAIQLALKLNMKLKMAGKLDFKGEEYFKEEIEPYLDHPLIEFLGEIGLSEKVDLLSNAKCNLHPTGFREPFGLTVMEAAYCGTPTLAVQRGSMQELIEEGRTGLLVEDFEEGYHSIEECFMMDREYISQRAKLLFNYQTMAKQYELAYEKVLENYRLEKGEHEEYSPNSDPREDIIEKILSTTIYPHSTYFHKKTL
jgi:glycosyltransferase involved in cell wall biosynthesis